MPIKSGDFVLMDYVLKVKETGEIYDVTMEDQAKAANVYSPEITYEPKLIAVGQGWMLKGIDSALLDTEVGQEKDVEIAPQNAFGERDGTKVKIVPARDLTSQGVTPRPGARIEISGQLATIRSVGSGRVTIDFNHPLAGRTLEAKLYIRKLISEPAEQIRELIHRRIRNVSKDKFNVSYLGNLVTIEMPEEAFTLEDIQFAKKGIAKEIGKYFENVTNVQFIEPHLIKAAPKPEAKAAEEPAKEAPEEAEAGAESEEESEGGKSEKKTAKAKKKGPQPEQ
jgi:peptidylprolyl isomerase